MPQVTSLELSRELKEWGFKAESKYVWWGLMSRKPIIMEYPKSTIDQEDIIANAYQFHELWAVLPAQIQLTHYELMLMKVGGNSGSVIGYTNLQNSNDNLRYFKHDNPTEAAGLLVKWCIENGHMEVKGGQ